MRHIDARSNKDQSSECQRWRRLPADRLAALIHDLRRRAGRGEHLSPADWHQVDLMRRRLARLEARVMSGVMALFALIADPASGKLSNREIARQTGLDHRYIAGYGAALAAVSEGPAADGGKYLNGVRTTPSASPAANALPSSGTRSTPARTVAFEPPALNSWDCWCPASADERRRFVDAVGLHSLCAAAPPDHRDAFRRRLEHGGAVGRTVVRAEVEGVQ